MQCFSSICWAFFSLSPLFDSVSKSQCQVCGFQHSRHLWCDSPGPIKARAWLSCLPALTTRMPGVLSLCLLASFSRGDAQQLFEQLCVRKTPVVLSKKQRWPLATRRVTVKMVRYHLPTLCTWLESLPSGHEIININAGSTHITLRTCPGPAGDVGEQMGVPHPPGTTGSPATQCAGHVGWMSSWHKYLAVLPLPSSSTKMMEKGLAIHHRDKITCFFMRYPG